MVIGVKETQEIIRQAVVLSRNEPTAPARLEPQEAGMATGPRHRKRSLLRPGGAPDYLRESVATADIDSWQCLDDDTYRFLLLRQDQLGRLADPPSQQFITEMEAQLRFADPTYEIGTYLGLVRMAADLDQTRQTYVTASEKGVFSAFARRLTAGRKAGENFDPDMVRRYLELVDSGQPATYRGLADFFRLVARAARLPLMAGMGETPTLSIAMLLQVVDLATRFNQGGGGDLEFQVGPMDVFLGARSVLFNRSVSQPTLSMVKELVLDEHGLYHEDLLEWLRSVAVFGSEATLLIPGSLTEDGFHFQGSRYTAVEMVMAAGERLARQPELAGRALQTLSDAILFKVQQQDGHKDRQVRNILAHFNRLLHGERRSAQRVSHERQQQRFDYMSAIQRAGDLAKEIKTGQFETLPAELDHAPSARPRAPGLPAFLDGESPTARVSLAPVGPAFAATAQASPAPTAFPAAATAKAAPDGTEMAPAAVLAGLLPKEYERALTEWDRLIGTIRRKLTAKSPVFKSMVAQLARVRAIDTCLVHGLSPSGGRLTSRLVKLLQDEALRSRLGIGAEAAMALEDTLGGGDPRFLASLESLVIAVYGFRDDLQGLQFRLRDRRGGALSTYEPGDFPPPLQPLSPERLASLSHGAAAKDRRADGREAAMDLEGAEPDEAVLKLILGCMLLGRDAEKARSGNAMGTPEPGFDSDGRLHLPDVQDLAALGVGNPFLAYGCLLRVGRETLGRNFLEDDPEGLLALLVRLTPEWRSSLYHRYRRLSVAGAAADPARQAAGLIRRPGWDSGCEMGFMGEMKGAYENSAGGAGLDSLLLAHLTAIQADIDRACDILEGEKLRSVRERIRRFVE